MKKNLKKTENTIITIESADKNSFIRMNKTMGGYEIHFLNSLFSRKELEGLYKIIAEALKIRN